jgi:hypothetical protein
MGAPGLGTAPQPLRTNYPQVGVNIGLDLGNEVMVGSQLGVSATAGTTSSAAFLSPDIVVETIVQLTAAQLIAMYTTPVVVLPAPGAGKSNIVHRALLRFTYPSAAPVQFTGGGVVGLQYAATAHGAGTLATATVAAAQIQAAASSDNVIQGASGVATQNTAIYVSNPTAPFAAGNGTAELVVWSSVI